MDIFSAARRIGQPFLIETEEQRRALPIAAHGIIGDGFTAALVRVDGVIDWLCFPRFDSPSVFGGILDADTGGATGVTPTARPFESLQRYDPDTNVLETLFTVPGQGVVRITDYMPWADDPRASIHEVHRRIHCIEGQVELDVIFDPRFGYGGASPQFEIREHGVLARGAAAERFAAVLDGGPEWRDRAEGGVRSRVTLKRGERRWMVLSWDAPSPEPVSAYRPFEHLRQTRQKWRQWSSRLSYDGPWRHHVLRSALCLKLLMYAPTGAMVAAPTASLPEWIGGARNWDYRYTWARDAAMAIRASNLIGFSSEARDFFHFIRDTIDSDHGLAVMYAIDGAPVPEERVLSHLAGHAGSTPVRIGNGARDQLQLDTAGALVDAAHLHEHFGGTLSLRTWRKLRRIVEMTRDTWHNPDHGIWEPRNGVRHNLHSKALCWLAMDRGAGLAGLFGEQSLRASWSACAQEIQSEICERGLDPTGQHFVAAYGENHVDGALLTLPLLRFLTDDHPLIVNTVERVRAELGDGPFVYRYRYDDGVSGPEGAFILCGFWLAEALALQGRVSEAEEVFVAHAEASNHLGLLAEEIDPRTQTQLGNFPQAFSHLGLINAALRIDLAIRLRDEGSARGPHLIRVSARPPAIGSAAPAPK